MKVYLDTVGCKLNQSEIERYATQFHSSGHELVRNMEEADIAVINTCAVTSAAAQDSRQKLRQAIRKNPKIQLVATGCLASLDSDLTAIIPGLSQVISNSVKDTLVEQLVGEVPDSFGVRVPVAGSRRRTRAFIKCQDGCNHYCTFCITRIARGKSRSVPVEQIKQDIDQAVRAGVKEIVLTGVQLGSWGTDQNPPLKFRYLLEEILSICPDDLRIRISSMEPWDVDQELLRLWRDQRLCQHFHLPLQSGSDRILRLMGRKTTQASFRDLVNAIRGLYPQAAITTDMIAGFPGETDADFLDTIDFLESLKMSGGHAFSYSAREGTPAAGFTGQVNGKERHRRSNQIRDYFSKSSIEFRSGWQNQITEVLWESAKPAGEQWRLSGWSKEYIRVEASSPSRLWNVVSKVRICGLTEDGCDGIILEK